MKLKKEIITAENAPAALGPYSQAVKCGGFVFVSGQVPINPENGELIKTGIEEQTRQILKNMQAILKEAGTTLDRVVKVTVFIKDMDLFSQVNKVYAQHFAGEYPARCFVEVSRLPRDAAIEMDAIALS
ncbi:MAG: RidA family protein [Spirochaetota bacterium]